MVLLAFFVAFGGVVGSVGFASAVGGAPSFTDATGTSKTTIEVTLVDSDTGINKSTIDQSDFLLSGNAEVNGIDTSSVTNGSTDPQVVVINLKSAVDADEVTVNIAGDGIADVSGNVLTSGSQTATGMDGVAPTFEGASRVDDTHIELNFSDGVDVSESTITTDDLNLSVGTVVSVTQSSPDGNVTIELKNPVDASSVDVRISDTGVIEDTAGNQLTDTGTSYTVNNMDGVAPAVTSVAVEEYDTGSETVTAGDILEVTAEVTDGGGVATVEVNASALGGPDALTLTHRSGDTYNETFTVTNPTASDGSVPLTVNATDGRDNYNDTQNDSVTLDTTAPAAWNFAPAAGATGTERQPTLGVNFSDANDEIDIGSVSVTVSNADGSKTYLSNAGWQDTGVDWDGKWKRLTVDLSEADVTLDEARVSVDVTVADSIGNAETYVWNFTAGTPDEGSSDDDWGRDDDDEETETEAPAPATSTADDSEHSTATATESPEPADSSEETTDAGDTAAATQTEPTDAAPETDSAVTEADGGSTETGVPGFGALVAVVALLAAALLARREA